MRGNRALHGTTTPFVLPECGKVIHLEPCAPGEVQARQGLLLLLLPLWVSLARAAPEPAATTPALDRVTFLQMAIRKHTAHKTTPCSGPKFGENARTAGQRQQKSETQSLCRSYTFTLQKLWKINTWQCPVSGPKMSFFPPLSLNWGEGETFARLDRCFLFRRNPKKSRQHHVPSTYIHLAGFFLGCSNLLKVPRLPLVANCQTAL